MSSLRSNPALLCAYHALQMSLFPMAVITVFYRGDIGMSMQQIMLLQGVFGLAMALFEFPSGYLADRIGYRRTLVLASLLNAVGWSLYVRADALGDIVLAEVVLGIGVSLISGTDSALLYESLREDGREGSFGVWNGRVRFFGQLGEGSAALAAGLLYAWSHRAPFALEIGIWLVNLLVAWRLVEPARHRPPLEGTWRQVRGMVRHLAVEHARLRAVVFLTIVLGMASYVPVWTIQLYATDAGVPEVWLGVLWAAANYTVAFASLGSSRFERRFGLRSLVFCCAALVAAGYAGMGLAATAWGVGGYFFLMVMRGLFGPALHHEEHRLIPSSDRAGFISLRSLTFRSSFLCLGPLVGWGVDGWGQPPVLLALGALLVLGIGCGILGVQRSGGFSGAAPERAG